MEFFGIGTWELMVIGLIALVVLGPKQMIVLARKAGELMRQLQDIWHEASRTLDKEMQAIETESPDMGGLGKEFDSLANEVKSAMKFNLPGFETDSQTIQPPYLAQDPNSEDGTGSLELSDSASDSLPTEQPASPPPFTNPTPETRYPAWTSKPEN